MIQKFNRLNSESKYSALKLNLDNTLPEIEQEYNRVYHTIENERAVSYCKNALSFMVRTTEVINSKFDPFGIDLDGWHDSFSYTMETKDYDEVLVELYEKYGKSVNVSPEVKLMFLVLSSAATFAVTKKMMSRSTTSGSGGSGGGLFGSLFGGKTTPPPNNPVQVRGPVQNKPTTEDDAIKRILSIMEENGGDTSGVGVPEPSKPEEPRLAETGAEPEIKIIETTPQKRGRPKKAADTNPAPKRGRAKKNTTVVTLV